MTSPKIFSVSIGKDASFWSQDELLTMAGLDLKDENKNFYFRPGAQTCNLFYGYNKIGEFSVGPYFDFGRDRVVWEEQYDATTNKFKFRLEVVNWKGQGSAPGDVRIKPAEYDPAWRLAWRYTAQNVIEIARLEGRDFHVIDVLQTKDFDVNGQKWLNERNPITLHKHQTYITIHASDYMTSLWSMRYTPEKWSDPWPKYHSYLMSEKEAAWISRDLESHAKSLATRTLPQSADMSATRLQGMLATLHQLAVTEGARLTRT